MHPKILAQRHRDVAEAEAENVITLCDLLGVEIDPDTASILRVRLEKIRTMTSREVAAVQKRELISNLIATAIEKLSPSAPVIRVGKPTTIGTMKIIDLEIADTPETLPEPEPDDGMVHIGECMVCSGLTKRREGPNRSFICSVCTKEPAPAPDDDNLIEEEPDGVQGTAPEPDATDDSVDYAPDPEIGAEPGPTVEAAPEADAPDVQPEAQDSGKISLGELWPEQTVAQQDEVSIAIAEANALSGKRRR